MATIEIVLCVAGIVLCIISFLLPDKQKESDGPDRKFIEETVKALVEEEIEGAKARLEEMQEETVSYGMEKAERSLEKITNEKSALFPSMRKQSSMILIRTIRKSCSFTTCSIVSMKI